METKKSLAYLKAKKKVEALKGLYGHIIVFVILNTIVILINAKVFSESPVDFSYLGVYFTTIMWGIGLFFHILYVLVFFNFNTDFLKNWEDKKIEKILKEQEEDENRQFSKFN
ncbi:2TM domain-containing protein [Ulvibacter antarcticus]|uniref:2TM domain-containing protein n=1 Tax=Ulvibacter antarcticus TaxID=442714 RepID=A0A3L9YY04_9FLAO|nr:2TM domain-containing protein [Ulvibacter antarcticus]RMA64710.1 2TM domain-containing protein [Ulvibacter antarcticus]